MLAVQERQPARLLLLDDADLHAVQQRQLAAVQALRHGHGLGVVGRGLLGIAHLAVARVALEHDLRRPPPALEHERPGAHRVRHDGIAVVLDHLACHGAHHGAVGEQVVEARRRRLDAHLEAVAVQQLQALDLGVVVEGLFLVDQPLAQLRQAQDACVLQLEQVRALVLRVVVPLDRVQVVRGGEFARLALEDRVVLEEDALPDAEGEGRAVVADLGQGHRGVGHRLRRARQIGVGQRRVEDRRGDRARVQVGDLGRVEAGFGHGEGIAQHARRVGGRGRGLRRPGAPGQREARGQRQQDGTLHGCEGGRRRRESSRVTLIVR